MKKLLRISLGSFVAACLAAAFLSSAWPRAGSAQYMGHCELFSEDGWRCMIGCHAFELCCNFDFNCSG